MDTSIKIIDISSYPDLTEALADFAACSIPGGGRYMAELLEGGESENWERVFAAVSGGEIVGCAALTGSSRLEDMRRPWLDLLFVDQRFRGQKLGRALADRVCRYAGSLGFKSVYLCTVSHGEFFERLGFRAVGASGGSGGGEAVVVMRKDLGQPR